MSEIPAANERALQVLKSNRYFALSTIDQKGPWVAGLAFVPAASPPRLYWMSRNWARHSKAIEHDNRVAGVIFDSRATLLEVESIQFSGTGHKVTSAEELKIVLRGHPADNGDEPNEDAIKKILDDPDLSAYCVTIEEAFVLDQAAWMDYQIDARESTDIHEVFETFLKSFERK